MPRPDVSAERTAQIIAAAITAFGRLGLSETRMEDIAREAGVSKGTLYLYFDSKTALIGAILDDLFGREIAAARELMAVERTDTDRLHALTEVLITDLAQLLPFVPIYLDLLGMALRQPEVRSVVASSFNEFLQILVPVIEHGIATGEFRQVDPMSTALALGTLIDGTLLLYAYDPETVDIESQIRNSVQLMLSGLAA